MKKKKKSAQECRLQEAHIKQLIGLNRSQTEV